MAGRHINPNAKEESGILLTAKDAKKVFDLFENKDKTRIKQKQEKFNALLKKSICSVKGY